MKLTICGSAKFEREFKEANEKLTLAGHVVYSLAVYPSDKEGKKNWYTEQQKEALDRAHKLKIDNSDAVYLIALGGYVGDSTKSEVEYAVRSGKVIYCAYPIQSVFHYLRQDAFIRSCPYAGCTDPLNQPPCALCYE